MPTHALFVDDENSGSQDVIQISDAPRNLNDGSFEVKDNGDGSIAIAWIPRNDIVDRKLFLLFTFL